MLIAWVHYEPSNSSWPWKCECIMELSFFSTTHYRDMMASFCNHVTQNDIIFKTTSLINKLAAWPPNYHKTARMFPKSCASPHSTSKWTLKRVSNNNHQWRIQDFLQEGGAPTLSENYMKMKEFGPVGGAHPWSPLGSANDHDWSPY